MKSIFVLSAIVVFGQLANASVCILVTTTANVPFATATTQTDSQYRTYEEGQVQGVRFLLKAGHGVVRLEAKINGALVASTFYSNGRNPAETDSLRLEVRAPNGQLVEAQCYDVDTVVP